MPTPESLEACYQRWLEIARLEQQAIRARKWKELNRYGKEKQELMSTVQEFEKQAEGKPRPREIHLLIHQIMDLEKLNNTLAQGQMSEVQSQLGDLHQRRQINQHLQKRYQQPGGGGMSRKA
ncbi:MAG: flagellar protein FliT [Verrucomicrobiae bacterium]|nr:flagellar protein FliT [Verrucomicrobiae bacterium]